MILTLNGIRRRLESLYIKVCHSDLEEPRKDVLAVDNGATRSHVGIPFFKVFGKVEHGGTVLGYDPVNKLYHIIYDDDDDTEEQ